MEILNVLQAAVFGLTTFGDSLYISALIPCKFFLFNYIQEKLKRSEFADDNELSATIRRILESIPADLFLMMFFSE
jgi:hypothetical protein